MKVGVLALQGAFSAHAAVLEALGARTLEVRGPQQLADCDRLVIPGGESTTMSMLLERAGLVGPLGDWLRERRPVFGTCAGAILLAHRVEGGRPDQVHFDALDITITRNAYGTQLDSFEADLAVRGIDGGAVNGVDGAAFHAVFIRAPRIERVGDGVDVLARIDGHPALVRSGNVLASTFHPELSGDNRIHAMFCGMRDQPG